MHPSPDLGRLTSGIWILKKNFFPILNFCKSTLTILDLIWTDYYEPSLLSLAW